MESSQPIKVVELGKRLRSAPHMPAVLAVTWVFLAAFLDLLPALVHGSVLGAQDILGVFGLGVVPGTVPHNAVASDQVQEMMPWAALAWNQVHHGHFPLWNPYSGFGMPLFGNFVSASLSLPALVSYLTPEHLVYTVQIYVKLVIAGTGVLWMGRRIGMRWVPASLASTAFMLSGSVTAWLGWPMSGTMGWLGWTCGNAILIVRRDRTLLHLAGLAVSVAFLVYAGHPETFVIVILCVAIIAIGLLIGGRFGGERQPIGRPLLALTGGGLAGLALAAPLLLPGLQIVQRSNRTKDFGYPQPPKAAVGFLFSTYHGLPIRGNGYFGPVNFYETSVYVGVVVLVLAGVALAVRWRDPLALSLAAVGVVCALLTYSAGVSRFLDRIPAVQNLQWTRSNTAMDFVLALLAGFGLQVLLEEGFSARVRRSFAVMTASVGLIVVVLWVHHETSSMPAREASIQARSFIWPTAQLVVVASVAIWLFYRGRVRPAAHSAATTRTLSAGLALFAIEAGFLLTATPGIWTTSHSLFPPTAAESQLMVAVGSSRVGFASCPSILGMPNLGILTEANDAFGVAETPAYDGTIPKSYFTAYYSYLQEPIPASTGFGQWCPSMGSGAIARHFGVSYILASPGDTAPPGTELVSVIGGEDLFKVPGGGVISVQPDTSSPDDAGAIVPEVSTSDPSVMRADVDLTAPSTAFVHVTDFPGWQASVDGKSIPLRPWGGTMLAAQLPAGRHVLLVRYRPAAFWVGELLATAVGVALVALTVWSVRRPRVDEVVSENGQDGDVNLA